MKNCIITAIYKLDTYQSKNGEITLSRNMEPGHYITGLRSILSLGYDTYVFYNEEFSSIDVEDMCKQHIKDFEQFKNQVYFLPYNFKTHNHLYETLNNDALRKVNKDPDKLVCWNPGFAIGKFDFFNIMFEKGFDNVIWMDAGLSDMSYIPIEKGGTYHDYNLQDYSYYYPNNKSAIFNPKFGNRLFEILDKHKQFICGIDSITSELREFCKHTLHYYIKIPEFSMTGAIIGCNKSKIMALCNEIQKTVDLFIQKYNYIFTEIDVLTFININHDFPKLCWTNFMPDVNYKNSLAQFFNELIYKDEQICFNNKYL